MSSIASQIQSMAASYGIPPSLALAVAQKESSLNQYVLIAAQNSRTIGKA